MDLILLPFAGGNKFSYEKIREQYQDFANFIPIELPGRGARIREKKLENLDEIAEDVLRQIAPVLQNEYAIYGHSMGALIGHLLIWKIKENNLRLPRHLFCSGCSGPSEENEARTIYNLSSDLFMEKIKNMGGSPEELLRDKEFMTFYEPILRADFKAVATHQYKVHEPLDIPITVMIGNEEGITGDQAAAWNKETTAEFTIHNFEGGHFFIYIHAQQIAEIIRSQLICTPLNKE